MGLLEQKTAELKPQCVISVSGGMDSTSLMIRMLALGYDVHVVSFFYGQKHSFELTKLQDNVSYLNDNNISLASFKIIDLQSVFSSFDSVLLSNNKESIPEGHYEDENMKATVVPNRNAIFAAVIYGHALSISNRLKVPVEMCLGVHSGDHAIYPDCRPEFYKSISQSFALGNWNSENVKFSIPYLYENKAVILLECIQNCLKLDLDFNEVMKNTLTSYNPDSKGRASGTSGSDIERIEAFLELGLKDPCIYSLPWEEVVENYKKIIKK